LTGQTGPRCHNDDRTIRKEIFVDTSPEIAFRVFTEQIAQWWPLDKYGIFLEAAASVV
jgi:uncharacterized protein YndB with AHSA1/START domain